MKQDFQRQYSDKIGLGKRCGGEFYDFWSEEKSSSKFEA